MEKIVKTGRTAVFTLDGTECRLTFAQKYRGFDIENRSDGDILVSFRSGSVEGDDETMTIPAGGSFNFMQMYESDTIYLTGTGKVAVAAKNDSNPNFKSSQGGGDSGTASGSVVGLQIGKCVDEHVSGNVSVSTLPYTYADSSAVVFNNEIHILGSNRSGNYTKHYKFNGTSWEEVSTLPYDFYRGSAVVFNNAIHILGGNGNNTAHYKFNGSSWEEVSTLPYGFNRGSAVVYNNEIHILGSNSSATGTNHYKFNGSSWESVSTLPYGFAYGSAVVYNNEIHILGGRDNTTKHYKYSGSSWVSVSTLPYTFYEGSAVVYNNEIHILGAQGGGTNHYKFYGGSWYNVSTLSPILVYTNSAVVLNNEIYYINYAQLNIVKNDNRHIATMLPKGAHIMLSDDEDINYVSNATKVSSNIAEVTETGYVEVLASMPEIYAAKGYLTFY